MRNKIFFALCLLALTCLLTTGCRKRATVAPQAADGAPKLEPGVFKTNEVSRYYKTLPPDGVLVQVGKRALTHAEFQSLVDERVDPHLKTGPRQDTAEVERKEIEAMNYVFANFMTRAAMLEEAESRGVAPSADDLKAADQYINAVCRRLRVTREEYAARFAGGQDALDRRIREEATLKALMRAEFGDAFEVSDREAGALKAELERLQAETEATNRIFVARLEALRARLASGEVKVSDDEAKTLTGGLPEGVEFSGVENRTAFEINHPRQRAALSGLKPGELSQVVELENTFDLYRLLNVKTAAEAEQTEYTFLTFSVPREAGWEIPDIARLKRDIAMRKRRERQVPWARGLVKKAGVLYPNGIRLFGDPDAAKTPHAQPPDARRLRKLAPAAQVKANKEG